MEEARADRGVLAGGLPFNRIGSGPPVVVLQGLTLENRALSGVELRFTMAPFRRLAEARSVYVVNRRPGLARGISLAEMAAEYAAMVRTEFEPPVEVIGLAEAGEWRPIAELMMRTVQPDKRLGRAVAGLFSPLLARSASGDPTDLIALLEAEDGHDFTPRLGEIAAPTLVACGELDPFSGADLAEETAVGHAGRPRARVRGKAQRSATRPLCSRPGGLHVRGPSGGPVTDRSREGPYS